MDSSEAWSIFVNLAAGRFVTWISDDGREGTLSLEVLMVWHALMLNPRAYLQFEKTVLKERDEVSLEKVLTGPVW